MATNLYEVLGLTVDADEAAIKKACRELSIKWHPDKNPDNVAEATRRFQELETVKAILTNPRHKAIYDHFLPQGHEVALIETNKANDADLEIQVVDEEAEVLAAEQAAANKIREAAILREQEQRDEAARLAAQRAALAVENAEPFYRLPTAFRTPTSNLYGSFFPSPPRQVILITPVGAFLLTNQATNTAAPNTSTSQAESSTQSNNTSPFRAQPIIPRPTEPSSEKVHSAKTNLGLTPTQPLENLHEALNMQFSGNAQTQQGLSCSLSENDDNEITLTIKLPPGATDQDVEEIINFLKQSQLVQTDANAAALDPTAIKADQEQEEEAAVMSGF